MHQELARLLSEIAQEYANFRKVMEQIDAQQAAQEHITGDWSATNVLSHILAWELEAAQVLRSIADGSYQPRKLEFDTWNAQAVNSRRHLTWPELLDQHAAAHDGLLETARQLPDELWEQDRPKGWLHAVTTEHYHEHLPQLQRLLS